MRYELMIIPLILINLIPIFAQADCVQPSRMTLGEGGYVLPGDDNNVRSEPKTDAEKIGQVDSRDELTIIAEPVCDESYVWIQVQSDELTGWTVEATADEYWMQPVTGNIYRDASISLMIPSELATDVTFEVLPELDSMGGLLPIRQSLTLEQEEEQKLGLPPYQLTVAPIGEFTEDDMPRGIEAVDELSALLLSESEFTEPILESVNPGQPLQPSAFPADPFIFAARRLLVVLPHYVDMENGRGVAFITMYGQDIFPANNDYVFYNFVGITHDEQYMVTLQYPVRTDMLINKISDFDFPDNWQEVYTIYIQQATESLNTLSPDDWQPSLNMIDTMVNSIYVTGGFE